MAVGKVDISVIFVGQGQCTLVEIFDKSPTPKLLHLLLFDCGTNKGSEHIDDNLEYIVNKASSRSAAGFDCIFLSHSDTDHTNKVKEVLEAIIKKIKTKKLVIGKVCYAGARANYFKNGYNILDFMEPYCTSKITALDSNYCKYDDTTEEITENLWATTDEVVSIKGIVANALSEDPDWTENDEDVSGTTPEAKNQISLVCGLFYTQASYIICGDATNTTMAAVNSAFDTSSDVFKYNHMSTVPHHGSRRTGLKVARGKDPEQDNIDVVKAFSKLLNSQTFTISAYEKHRHPSLQLMNLFVPVRIAPLLRDIRLNQKNSHCIFAYNDSGLETTKGLKIYKDAPYTLETPSNLFTTRYSDGETSYSYDLKSETVKKSEGLKAKAVINPFACWVFTETEDDWNIHGYADMTATSFTSDPVKLAKTASPSSVVIRNTDSFPAARQSQLHNRLERFR